MKLFGNILLPQDAAATDEGMTNVLVNYFNQGGEFVWPVLIILIVGLAIAFERVIQLILADANTRKFIVHVKEALHSVSDLRNSIGLSPIAQTLAIMNRHKLLTLMVLLSCAACEDAAVTRVSESYADENELQQYDKTGNQPSYKSSAPCHEFRGGGGQIGEGELLIAACSGEDSTVFETRIFGIDPIMYPGVGFTRSSHGGGCTSGAGQNSANLIMGVNGVNTCDDTVDSSTDVLSVDVTYQITSGHGLEQSFLARWPDYTGYPDTWATAVGGIFTAVGSSGPAVSIWPDAPVEFDECHAFLIFRGGLSEMGGGSEGCGPELQWAIGGRVYDLGNDGHHRARLVRVAVDKEDHKMAYDWRYSAQYTRVYPRPNDVRFEDGVTEVAVCEEPYDYSNKAFFGYFKDQLFYAEGWTNDPYQIQVGTPDPCDHHYYARSGIH